MNSPKCFQTELKRLIGKDIIISEPKWLKSIIGQVCKITKANQTETIRVEAATKTKYLHFDTTVTCIVISPSKNPEYYL